MKLTPKDQVHYVIFRRLDIDGPGRRGQHEQAYTLGKILIAGVATAKI